jgi:hypothetical protein
LNKRATESELRLKRLYDAIEASIADLDDPALKDRIDGLKTIRDQAKADAERAQAMLQNSGQKAVTPQMLRKFATTARQRIRLEGGGKWRKLSAHSGTEVAEGVGFEPTVRLPVRLISSQVPSTNSATLPYSLCKNRANEATAKKGNCKERFLGCR